MPLQYPNKFKDEATKQIIKNHYSVNETLNINNKKVFIVEKHHEVLQKWEGAEGCNMITFDCHTDTRKAFLVHCYHHEGITAKQLIADYKSKKLSIAKVIDMLRYDEHIDFATKANLIDTAFVVSPASPSHNINNNSKIIEYECYDILNNHNYFYQRSMALDNFVIDAAITHIKSQNNSFFENYILDIDLDYINTLSVFDKDLSSFRGLMKNAKFITIAKEPEHVKLCYKTLVVESEDNSDFSEENINADIVLKKIIEEVEKIKWLECLPLWGHFIIFVILLLTLDIIYQIK